MSDNPQPQTVSKCADLREAMQDKIFTRMQKHHDDQMETLTGIKEDIAFRKGREEAVVEKALKKYIKTNGNGTAPVANQNLTNGTRELLVRMLINWGPGIAVLAAIGAAVILKSKGYL